MIVDRLILEVTRKCNMHCRHCLRGAADSVDMSFELIDAMFNDIESVGHLTITGGEPTLNIAAIRHALDVVMEKDIPVYSFWTCTNGKIYSQEFVDVVNDWMVYCMKCNGTLDPDPNTEQFYASGKTPTNEMLFEDSGLAVSLDTYHEPIPIGNYVRYRMLGFYDKEKENYHYEDRVINRGFANDNGIGKINSDVAEIEYETNYKSELNDEGTVLVHELYVSATGEVLGDCDVDYDSQEEYSIGNINEKPLIDVINAFISEQENLQDMALF